MKFLYISATLMIALLSCSKSDNRNKIRFDISNHKDMIREFKEKAPKKYSYTYCRSGYNYIEYDVYVTEGIVDLAVPADMFDYTRDYYYGRKQSLHIDTIFKEITDIYEEYQGTPTENKPYYVKDIYCEYDNSYSFPASHRFAFYLSPDLEADENFGASIHAFRVIEE